MVDEFMLRPDYDVTKFFTQFMTAAVTSRIVSYHFHYVAKIVKTQSAACSINHLMTHELLIISAMNNQFNALEEKQ